MTLVELILLIGSVFLANLFCVFIFPKMSFWGILPASLVGIGLWACLIALRSRKLRKARR